MQTHEWEALLDGTEGITLTAGHETVPAVDDDPDQSSVDLPCVRITGMEGGWSNIAAPGNLVPALASSIDSVTEVVRLRRAIEDEIRSLRAPLCSHMPEGDELDEYLEEWEMQGYAAHILTRILEGDTHE